MKRGGQLGNRGVFCAPENFEDDVSTVVGASGHPGATCGWPFVPWLSVFMEDTVALFSLVLVVASAGLCCVMCVCVCGCVCVSASWSSSFRFVVLPLAPSVCSVLAFE